ncbi:MAG: hypothetical protein HYS62_01800 [Candidatus Aenigmarchaeota archaeon]|nr:hypothetical protein [Candidatus Aenigmarchaeota archaeon]
MKGISEIIATILMLMITLAISGTAYIFISGAFTQQTQGLEVVDAYCQDGSPDVVNLIMRNLGTATISASGVVVTQTNPTEPVPPENPNRAWVGGITSIAPGTTGTLQDACEGNGPRTCIYRVLPPIGRSIIASVSCT